MARKKKNETTPVPLDPRKAYFLANYLDPDSKTFGNAKQSAIKAGFDEKYADNILNQMPDWLRRELGKSRAIGLLEKAERNLEEILDLPSKTQAMGAFGPIFEKRGKKKIPVMAYATGLIKVKNDASQFVAKTVGRTVYGEDGSQLPKGTTVANFIQINIHAPEKQQ